MANYTYIEGSLAEVIDEFHNSQIFGIDLETTGLSPIDSRIVLCQIGFPNGNNYVINTASVDLKPLKPFLEDKKWLKIIQNATFEEKFFQKHLNTKITGVFDTKLAEGLITSQLYG